MAFVYFQETGLTVKAYLDPAAVPDNSQAKGSPCHAKASCIVPVVVCCIVIPAIGIIVGGIIVHVT